MKCIRNEISDTVHEVIWSKVYYSVYKKISYSVFGHTNNQLHENVNSVTNTVRYMIMFSEFVNEDYKIYRR